MITIQLPSQLVPCWDIGLLPSCRSVFEWSQQCLSQIIFFSFCILDPIKGHTFIQKSLFYLEEFCSFRLCYFNDTDTCVKTLATSFAGSPQFGIAWWFPSQIPRLARKLHRCCVSFLLAFHQQTRRWLVPLTVKLNNFGHLLGHLLKRAFPLHN